MIALQIYLKYIIKILLKLLKKEKIDIVPLCHNVGAIITLSGLIFLLNGLWADFTGSWFTITMVVWFIVAALDLLYIEKSHRYQK